MLVMQLRKCCNHPYLFPGAEPGFDGVSTGASTGSLYPIVSSIPYFFVFKNALRHDHPLPPN